MNSLELYLLQSSISLAVLYSFYMLFLRKETWHNWNRFYLLFAGLFSALVPLIKINFPDSGYESVVTGYLAPVAISVNKPVRGSSLNVFDIILYLYITVLVLLFIRFLIRIFQIYRLYRGNEINSIKGYKTVLLEKEKSPFSFFKIIFLTKEKLTDPALDKLIAHEEVHINNYHSVDILLFECLAIMQWFNPAAWFCKKEIVAQHEFLADSALITEGISTAEYKDLLVAYSFNLGGTSITNNFNSLLKRRLEMLSQKKITRNGKLKLLLSLPLLALIVFFLKVSSGCIYPDTAANNKNIFPALQKPDSGKHGVIIVNPAKGSNLPSNGDAYTMVEQMPQYPGSQDELLRFIASNVVYPEQAKRAEIQGKVIVAFVVEKDGSLSDIKVIKGIGSGLDEEAVRVTKLMKNWIPGKQKGQEVRVQMVVPFQFVLQ